MANQSHSHDYPRRDGYISGSEFFFYSTRRGEFGTNKRHQVAQELTALILDGLDEYEVRQMTVHGEHDLSDEVHEILDCNDNVIALRVNNPQLIFNGLKGCLLKPLTDSPAHTRGLAIWAEQDLEGFSGWLIREGIWTKDSALNQ